MTWDLTLETLIIFLTIENNNINNYIVTFEKKSDADSIRNSCDVFLNWIDLTNVNYAHLNHR